MSEFELRRLIEEEGLTLEEVGEKAGTTKEAVRQACMRVVPPINVHSKKIRLRHFIRKHNMDMRIADIPTVEASFAAHGKNVAAFAEAWNTSPHLARRVFDLLEIPNGKHIGYRHRKKKKAEIDNGTHTSNVEAVKEHADFPAFGGESV